ncbi:MAG: rhomboid family intramembrane serine protease GlpG [Aeromonadaceae bacterium]|jgi:GlpG protein|nr:rhomboid family intramembrane serine protease GlpG [Aeromonadaceae bacterium]MBP8127120.1 rhomboid family intramembrane serine protease GlpG [Aeromonadaceae bacterium]
MKQLLVINDARLAQSLADYLSSRGMHCELTQSEVGITVWLADESRSGEAEPEVKRFLKEPYHPRYAEASWQSGTPNSRIDYSAGHHSLTAHFLMQAGPVTLLVMALCTCLFILQLIGLNLYASLSFHQDVSQLSGWQIWRFVTPAFLHFSALHLIFNLMWWWYLAGLVERQLGTSKLLTLLLVGAVIPNLLEFLLSGPDFGGLSAVVNTLVGYCWIVGRMKPDGEVKLQDGIFIFMVVWLAIGFSGLLGNNLANVAHLSGLAIGLLHGWLDGRKSAASIS